MRQSCYLATIPNGADRQSGASSQLFISRTAGFRAGQQTVILVRGGARSVARPVAATIGPRYADCGGILGSDAPVPSAATAGHASAPQAADGAGAGTWVDEMAYRIDEFSQLAAGWDGLHAEAPSALARQRALRTLFAAELADYRPVRVAPSVEGGIALSWRHDNRIGDIECFNDGTILGGLVTRAPGPPPQVFAVPARDLAAAVARVRSFVEAGELTDAAGYAPLEPDGPSERD